MAVNSLMLCSPYFYGNSVRQKLSLLWSPFLSMQVIILMNCSLCNQLIRSRFESCERVRFEIPFHACSYDANTGGCTVFVDRILMFMDLFFNAESRSAWWKRSLVAAEILLFVMY